MGNVLLYEMLIVRHLGTPNLSFPVASSMRDLGLFISVVSYDMQYKIT